MNPTPQALRASYNITNDKLKIWFDSRLPDSLYEQARNAKFLYWHGSQCFAAKWSTQAEDFVLQFDIEIEEDYSPDDVAARVERFSGYASKAESSASATEHYFSSGRANTERRQKNALRAIEKNYDLAQHWQRRIEGAICHASYKEKPNVIRNRIKRRPA